MIKISNKRMLLTDAELNVLRQRAAQNGRAINSVSTESELLEALIAGLDDATVTDMLAFLDARDAIAHRRDEN